MNPALPTKQPAHRELLLVLMLAAALTAWRFALVAHLDWTLFYDEAQYWDWSRTPAFGYFSKPPVIAWLIALGRRLFGDSVLGVKALPMLLYPLNALVLWAFAGELHPRLGLPAALAFLTLPMVGLLGLYATTDAPLLLAWTAAAWALWRAQTTDRPAAWLALGLACGMGLMAKYTMAAFALSALPLLWLLPGPRRGVLRPGPWLSLALALLLLAPNLVWNATHGFPTLHHTADITAGADRPGGMAEALLFVIGQALVLGPVAAWWTLRGLRLGTPLVVASLTGRKDPSAHASSGLVGPIPGAWVFAGLLTLPLLGVATAQCLVARANLNWAAPAHVGSCLLLGLALLDAGGQRCRRALLAVVAVNIGLTALVAHLGDLAHLAGRTLPGKLDVFVRMRGWDHAFAGIDQQLSATQPDWATGQRPLVLAHDRLLLAQAAYQLRAHDVRPVAWKPDAGVHDHYELSTRLSPSPGQTIWLLTRDAAPPDITDRFDSARPAGAARWEVAPGRWVEVRVTELHGFRGYAGAEPAAMPARPGSQPHVLPRPPAVASGS